MTIEKQTVKEGNLTLNITGRLDTITAPELEKESQNLNGINELVLDFEKLEYISSAGLRVLLLLSKIMKKQGTMKIKNVNEMINEVFTITGFSNILDIE